MQNLKKPPIASNKLNFKTFSPELVNGLNLTYIDISDNQFDQIPYKVLGELVNLQIVIFYQARGVKHLHFREEFLKITQLDLLNVTELGNDYNVSHNLQSDYFYNLRKCPIVHFDLSYNNMYKEQNDTFLYLTKLRYLNMDLTSLGFNAIRNVFLGLHVPFLGNNLVENTIKYSLFDRLMSSNIALGLLKLKIIFLLKPK